MEKKDIISFEVVYAPNEEKYILRVKKNGVSIEAPRLSCLEEALYEAGLYMKEFPLQKKFKVEVSA